MKLKSTIVCTIDEVRQQIRPDDPNLVEKLSALSDEDKLQLVQEGLVVDDENQGVVIEGEIDPDGDDVVALGETESSEAKAKEEAEAAEKAAAEAKAKEEAEAAEKAAAKKAAAKKQ